MIICSIFKRSFRTCLRRGQTFLSYSHPSSFLQLQTSQKFCSDQKGIEDSIDQLKNYEKFLIKHNESIKKPHEKLKSEEQRIIQKYIHQKQYSQIIAFMLNNTSNSLCSMNTAANVDESLAANWGNLTKDDQKAAAHALVHFRENKVFDIFRQPIEKRIKLNGLQSIQCEQLIVYLCGELINRKSLRFLSKLLPKISDRLEIYAKIYKYLDQKHYKGTFSRQKRNLLQYIGLILDPTLNKKQNSDSQRQRSPLQVNIQSFMTVLDIEFQRQIKINNFFIDYLAKVKIDNKVQNFIIQANGNYHYTINEKLKGKEIIRNLIINEYAPLRIIHYQDFLISKGNRNKLAYIESLFTEKTINWERIKKGKDSHWEVKVEQELMKSAK